MAEVLLGIRRKLEADQIEEAKNDLDTAFRELMEQDAETICRLPETELLAKLSTGPTHTLRSKTYLLIALLQAAGEAHAAANDFDQARVCWVKALNLLLGMHLQDAELTFPDFVPKIDALVAQLEDAILPLTTQALLWRYYERMGQYGKAEDALWELLDLKPGNEDLKTEAILFYERLLRKSDEELETGNLPKAEVKAAVAELRAN